MEKLSNPWPSTASKATLLASHITSNGLDKFGETIMGASINFYLSASKNFIYDASKTKAKSFSRNLHLGLVTLAKSLTNLRWNPTCP